MKFIDCINFDDSKIAIDIIGEGFITYGEIKQFIENPIKKEDKDKIIGVEGRSNISNILEYLKLFNNNAIPTFLPFKTGKVSNEILEERRKHLDRMGLGLYFENISPCFLQLSSGTTGSQKGYIISLDKLLKQSKSYKQAVNFDCNSVVVSWLPLNHDMGLFTSLFFPLLNGSTSIIIPTEKWIYNYYQILDLIQEKKSTHVWFPNFCFELLSNFQNTIDLQNTKFFNCAEVCRKQTQVKFEEKFNCKVYSCYAAAENVFCISQSKNCLYQEEVSSCGTSIDGVEIKLNENKNILIKSEFLFDFKLVEGKLFSPDLDEDGFFNMEDIGFIFNDEFFVSGRIKDLAIINGKNINLVDIEAEINKLDIKKGKVSAIYCFNENKGTDDLVILYESKINKDLEIKKLIFNLFDISCFPYRISNSKLIKTTSGKMSRNKNLELFLKRKEIFDVISLYLKDNKSYIGILDETTELRNSGILESFDVFSLISKIHIDLSISIDWNKDFSKLNTMGDFIDEFS